MTKVAIEIIRYSDRDGRQGRLQFFEKNKSFFGGKKEKETSLKENRGKDFLEKTGEGANSFLLEKAKKFFQKKGSLTRT